MQELGREGIARLFFKEYCKGHPELLKPAEDNILRIKSHTLGTARWKRMTAYRKVLTRDKFTDVFHFIKFIQEKAGDKNDTYNVVKRINRQDIMRRKRNAKTSSYGDDDVQNFDSVDMNSMSLDDDGSDIAESVSTAPAATKSKKKPPKGKGGPNKKNSEHKVTIVDFD